jgi:glucans biosynthesis protein
MSTVQPMIDSPRCGARTRKGSPCAAPAVQNKKRCRMHGGAKGSGAPLNNKNAYKTGWNTKEFKERRRRVKEKIRISEEFLEQLKTYISSPKTPSSS